MRVHIITMNYSHFVNEGLQIIATVVACMLLNLQGFRLVSTSTIKIQPTLDTLSFKYLYTSLHALQHA